MREWHPAFEEYCEAIFELREDDVDVIQARIAERLEVSRPAVSEMIRRMEKTAWSPSTDGSIRLTDDGMSLAESVVRRHRLAERFLTDMLGLSWAEAHIEAGRWEHVISPTVETAMMRVLGRPHHLPARQPHPRHRLPRAHHGHPRPPRRRARASSCPASPRSSSSPPGCSSTSRSPRCSPATQGTVTAASPDGTTTVEIDGRHVGIGSFASTRILVAAA